MNPQMKKGFLEMCILHLVSQNDIYGYDILKIMSVFFPEINESAFYAILRRINKAEFTEYYFKEPTIGPKRKYYRITEIGKNELDNYIKDWDMLNKIGLDIGIKFG